MVHTTEKGEWAVLTRKTTEASKHGKKKKTDETLCVVVVVAVVFSLILQKC